MGIRRVESSGHVDEGVVERAWMGSSCRMMEYSDCAVVEVANKPALVELSCKTTEHPDCAEQLNDVFHEAVERGPMIVLLNQPAAIASLVISFPSLS